MPNYSLVVNSKFRPFSYQEMLAPVQQSTEAHQAVEDAYGQLQVKADEWKKIASQEPNSQAAAAYLKYSQDLENAATELAKNGLQPNARNNMWNLTKRYASEIHPIEEGYVAKQKDVAEQMAKDGTTWFETDASKRSIDDYIANPFYKSRQLDKETVYKRSKEMFSTFLNDYRDNLSGAKGRLDAYNKLFYQKYGLNRDEANAVIKTMQGVADGKIDLRTAIQTTPQIGNMIQSIYSSFGADTWNNPQAQNEILQTIADGVVFGVGPTKVERYADVAAQAELDLNNKKRYAQFTAGLQNNQNNSPYVDTIDRIDIKKDDRTKMFIKQGILHQDENGRLHFDKNALINWANHPEKKEEAIKAIKNEQKQLAYIGSNLITPRGYNYSVLKYVSPDIKKSAGITDSDDQQIQAQKLQNYVGPQQNHNKNLLDVLNSANSVEMLINDLSDITGLDIQMVQDSKGNIDIDTRGIDAALNNAYGDTYNLNQDLRFPIAEENSKYYTGNIISKGNGYLKHRDDDMYSTYEEKGGKYIKNKGTVNLNQIENGTVHDIRIGRGGDGKNKVFMQVSVKTGTNENKLIYVELDGNNSKNLVNIAEGIRDAKRGYYRHIEEIINNPEYRDEYGNLVLPENVKKELDAYEQGIITGKNLFGKYASEMGLTNKIEPINLSKKE